MKSDNVINSIDNKNKLPQKRKTKLSKIPRDKIRASLAQTQISTYTRYAIEGIVEIKTKIHRIRLFAERFNYGINYEYFKRKFPNLSINKSFDSKTRNQSYKNQLIVKTDICTLNIFIKPVEGYLPAFMIELTPKEGISLIELKTYLSYLDELIFDLKVSSVEYTNDIYFNSPNEIESLFVLAKRSLYVPYKKDAKHYGECSMTVGKNIRFNATFECGDVKIYERGPDDEKTKLGWNFDKMDRLRLENTAKRGTLKSCEIDTLTEFIDDCKFLKINKNIYKFKQFKSKELPHLWDWDSYSTTDDVDQAGTFLQEYGCLRLFYQNIRQYMKDVEEFEPLKTRLTQEMKAFDSAWKASNII